MSSHQYGLLGDNLDGNIGNNTQVKTLGGSRAYSNYSRYYPMNISRPFIGDSIRGTTTSIFGPSISSFPAPDFKLSSGAEGPIINVMNQINNYTNITEMTSVTGAFNDSLGAPFPMDMETRVYPDFGFVTNNQPRLPGDSRPQQPIFTESGTWRDSWLEASIGEIVYGIWN